MSMSVIDKRGRLQGMHLAWESQNTAPPAHQQQQQLMSGFLQMMNNQVICIGATCLVTQSDAGCCLFSDLGGGTLKQSS
jgi:hypothetical protein